MTSIKFRTRRPAALAAGLALVLSGCSTIPDRNPALEQARSQLGSAQNDPQIAQQAADELKRAAESLARAERAMTAGEPTSTIDHLAYMTGQRVAVARETATSRTAQAVTANAAAERDRLRLSVRTAEVDTAQRRLTASQDVNAQQTRSLAAADAAAARGKADQDRSAARVSDLEAQLKDLNAKQTERGLVVTLGDVLFDTGQSRLLADGSQGLVKVAAYLKGNPQRSAAIEGYTDSVGPASYNFDLSERRAQAVKSALLGLGVGANQLSTRSLGPGSPVASNQTAAGRQLNRRVEIVFAPQPGDVKGQ